MKSLDIKPKNAVSKVPKSNNVKVNATKKSSSQVSNTKTNNRRYLTVVTIVAGIITLINEQGQVEFYRQRGIGKLDAQVRLTLINVGFLHRNWNDYKELPSNISIRYEDEEILGKAKASFPINEAMIILGLKK